MIDPIVIGDQARYAKVAKQSRDLEPVVEKFREMRKLDRDIAGAKELIRDAEEEEMREMAAAELPELEERRAGVENDLKVLLLPKDPNDEKNVIFEVRAGTGGEEACLFAAEILRMYARYAESRRWKFQVTDSSETGLGGIQKAEAIIEGDKVYSRLKHESGVHRVQRVPQTEASGRIHTSAVTVAILPEAEEVDVKIDPKDIRIDTFCSSGPGGQSVNTTYSAVRITHLPTNTVVSMQDEKSQIKNREKAMRILRSRLLEIERQKQQSAISAERRSQVGSGDRSEKIRTYNFKENRVTDHRIGLTIHQLDQIMEGGIDELIDAVVTHFQAEKLKEETEKQAATV
jgi:peptide chain release factor 1